MAPAARNAPQGRRQRSRRGGGVRAVHDDPWRAGEDLDAAGQLDPGERACRGRSRARRRPRGRGGARRRRRARRSRPGARPGTASSSSSARARRREAEARAVERFGEQLAARARVRAARAGSRAPRARALDHRERLGRERAHTAGTPGFRIPAFSRGDRGERVAEQLGVLELDARDAADRGRHDVGRVQPSPRGRPRARRVHAQVGEEEQCRGGGRVEEPRAPARRPRRAARPRAAAARHGGRERSGRDLRAVDAEALGPALEVRRSEGARRRRPPRAAPPR